MKHSARKVRAVLLAVLATIAFGSSAFGASSASDESGAAQARGPRFAVCKLLTDAQVKSVVPDLVGSMTVSDGESLMKSVEAYQCSHVNSSAQGLLVIINIAADDASFKTIRGSESRFSAAKKLDIGDASWIYPRDGGLYVTVHKGRAVIDLQLNTKDAAQKGAVLTELARDVAAKVN